MTPTTTGWAKTDQLGPKPGQPAGNERSAEDAGPDVGVTGSSAVTSSAGTCWKARARCGIAGVARTGTTGGTDTGAELKADNTASEEV